MINGDVVNLHDDNLMLTYELEEAGYDDRAISRMVRSGLLVRIRQGAYTYGSHWNDLDDLGRRLLTSRAVLRRCRVPTVLAGPSAADVHGAPVWDLGQEVHVARLDAKADRREAGRVPHRGILLPEDLAVVDGLPVTSGTRTALDLVTMTDVEHALVVVDGLLHRNLTTIDLLRARAAQMTHGPHTLQVPIVLGLADGRHESAGETRSACLMRRFRIPPPVPQWEIRDRYGRVVARVDFAWPEYQAFMEFDGKVKYLRHRRPGESVTDAVLREKRREELVCGLTGWRCIRSVWADLHHQARTAARIEATLRGQTWAA